MNNKEPLWLIDEEESNKKLYLFQPTTKLSESKLFNDIIQLEIEKLKINKK